MNEIGLKGIMDNTNFQKGMAVYNNGLAAMNKTTQITALVMGAAYGGMSMRGMTLAVTIGTLMANAVQAGSRALIAHTQAAAGVVAEYERLSLSFNTLIAKEYKQAGAVDNMTDALKMAAPATKELIDWVTMLAVKSPFDQAGIAAAMQTAVAYGFVTQAAKSVEDAQARGIMTAQRLTEAMVNWAAGAGKSTHELAMVTRALGQMRSTGRLTRQDLMQLTTAGVDVNTILAEMGLNFGNVTKANIDATLFIEKFVKVLETDFAGAAERQANTLSGLMSSIGDLQKLATRNFFGPMNEQTGEMFGILGAIKPLLVDIVNKLSDPKVIESIKAVGIVVGEWLVKPIDYLRGIVNGTNESFTAFVASMKETIPSLVVIGTAVAGFIALVTVFNVTAAAITAVITVIGGLISVIGFLISPIGILSAGLLGLAAILVSSLVGAGKEGKAQADTLANDAESWGSNIVQQFAHGIIMAAVAVIDALTYIGRIISSWLMPGSPPKLLPYIDKWGAGAMTAYMRGWLKADFSVFKDLASTISGYLRSLSDKMLKNTALIPTILGSRAAIAAAISDVERTGIVTEAMIDRIMRASKKLTPEFRDYIRLSLQMIALADKQKEAQQGVTDADNKMAEAQYELNAVTSYYNTLIAYLNKQLNQETEILDENQRLAAIQKALATGRLTTEEKARLGAEANSIMIKKQIRAIEEQRDVEAGAIEERMSAIDEERQQAQSRLDAINYQISAMSEQLDLQKELISVQSEQNQLLAEQIRLLEQLAAAAKGAGGAGAGGTLPIPTLPPAFGDIGEGFGGIPGMGAESFADTLRAQFEGMWQSILTDSDLTLISGKFAELEAIWTAPLTAISATWNTFWSEGPFPAWGRIIDRLNADLSKRLSDWMVGVWLSFTAWWIDISTGFSTWYTELSTKGEQWITDTNTSIDTFITERTTAWTTFWTVTLPGILTTAYTDMLAKLEVFVGDIIQWFQDLYDDLVGHSIIPDMMKDIGTAVYEGLFGEEGVIASFAKFITDLPNMLKDKTFLTLLYDAGKTFVNWIVSGIQSMTGVLGGVARWLIDQVLSRIPGYRGTGTGTGAGLNSGSNAGIQGTSWSPTHAIGGAVSAGRGYIVGDTPGANARSMEYFRSSKPGYMVPNNRLLAGIMGNNARGYGTSPSLAGSNTYNRTVNMTINPSYSNHQSEASIRYDVSAALLAARI